MPFTRSSINAMNLTSDARNVMSAVSLAKMRAAATFSQARLVVIPGNATYMSSAGGRTLRGGSLKAS